MVDLRLLKYYPIGILLEKQMKKKTLLKSSLMSRMICASEIIAEYNNKR